MKIPPIEIPAKPWCLSACAFLLAATRLHAVDLTSDLVQTWAIAEQRCESTIGWLGLNYGDPGMYAVSPSVGDTVTGHWAVVTNTRDWRNGFWPGILWILAQHTGSPLWRQRAIDWSAPQAATTNADHDIGFITLSSLGKQLFYQDDLNDPAGLHTAFARSAIGSAATKLGARYNQPNGDGVPVPTGFTRSWNPPFEGSYPVCIDNLMNVEVMFLAYELGGRQVSDRPLFDHAIDHVRSSIAKHMRPDGSTYHVVRHFETGPLIGQIERKDTLQGYGDETTWSRGQAWAIYGLTSAYRHARRDPGTNATDILSAARAAADYFISHLPNNRVDDPYNYRVGDFVPPSDFDASLGEPAGPWNDANDNYDPVSGTGLGDRRPATLSFTYRDSSAAAVAAAGLIELSGCMTDSTDRKHYLEAAEEILHCLMTFDGDDLGSEPDYLCTATDAANPGILKAGSVRWGEAYRSLIYGDYYFLEAIARYETLKTRELLEASQSVSHGDVEETFEFVKNLPAPTVNLRVLRSPDLIRWTSVAAKTGAGSWTGAASASETAQPDGSIKVKITHPSSEANGFYRVLTRSIEDSGP